jgi:hypothetical protein
MSLCNFLLSLGVIGVTGVFPTPLLCKIFSGGERFAAEQSSQTGLFPRGVQLGHQIKRRPGNSPS